MAIAPIVPQPPTQDSLEWAAQIWCRPETSDRVMDAPFATAIAAALDEREAARRAYVASVEGQRNLLYAAAELFHERMTDGRSAADSATLEAWARDCANVIANVNRLAQ